MERMTSCVYWSFLFRNALLLPLKKIFIRFNAPVVAYTLCACVNVSVFEEKTRSLVRIWISEYKLHEKNPLSLLVIYYLEQKYTYSRK